MKNGSGDEVIKKIALSLEQKAEYNLKKRIAAIEPAIVLSMSLIIVFILLSVMLPLVDVMSVMG
jgi:type IV pilus assembly protein PilC